MTTPSWDKVNKIFASESSVFSKKNIKATSAEIISKLDFLSTQHGQEMETPVECLIAFQPFLRYYQFLGLLPISISSGNTGLIIRRPNLLWIFTGITLFIQTVMTAKSIHELALLLAASASVNEEVAAVNSIIYYFHIISMSLIMLKHLNLLPNFFEACKKVEIMCKKYQLQNDNLIKHCWLLFGYFGISQILGNALYYYSEAEKNNVTTAADFSKSFALNEDVIIDNTGVFGFILSIFELHCDCCWIFGDIMTSLMSFMLARYFSRLNWGISSSQVRTVDEIEELRKDHRAMKDLVEQCNQVFSPIILVNFIGNTGYLLTRLYTGLSEDLSHPKLIVRIESIYAFIYQINKIVIPTWLAAILNETAHEPLDTVHDWPSLVELPECRDRIMVIGRFISQLVNDPVALSGCGYFTITKSFMVTMISGIMTYEVIILQFQQSGL